MTIQRLEYVRKALNHPEIGPFYKEKYGVTAEFFNETNIDEYEVKNGDIKGPGMVASRIIQDGIDLGVFKE